VIKELIPIEGGVASKDGLMFFVSTLWRCVAHEARRHKVRNGYWSTQVCLCLGATVECGELHFVQDLDLAFGAHFLCTCAEKVTFCCVMVCWPGEANT
jgi:hypothetical protein